MTGHYCLIGAKKNGLDPVAKFVVGCVDSSDSVYKSVIGVLSYSITY